MKKLFPLISLAFIAFSCNNAGKSEEVSEVKEMPAKQSFFPVTEFIKGEIYSLKNKGANPLKYTTINNHTDSIWVKMEDIDSIVSEFLHPEIDSTNLTSLFTEKNFLDQSINAITLTYDPIAKLPDSMQLRQWNVYIDPESNKVKRVYMVKEINKNQSLQLIWVSKEWCKITSIITDESGATTVEKEEKLFWGF